MTTLTEDYSFYKEKLSQLVDDCYSYAWEDGKEGLNRREDINTDFTNRIISLIQSTVKGCLPVKTIKSSSDTSSYDIGWVAGRNQAIDTITANLKEKEVL